MKKEQSRSVTTIITSGVVWEIVLGVVWLLITQSGIIHWLGITTLSLRSFLIAATITSLILGVITSLFYYRRRKDIAITAAITVLLTAFGVFAAVGFTIEIGFRL